MRYLRFLIAAALIAGLPLMLVGVAEDHCGDACADATACDQCTLCAQSVIAFEKSDAPVPIPAVAHDIPESILPDIAFVFIEGPFRPPRV